MGWTQNDIPNLDGKVVIVTGANSGLGLESAKDLAAKGATVVMAVRNLPKGEQARAAILQAAPGSTHGYDVVDHSQISDMMGGRAAFERLAADDGDADVAPEAAGLERGQRRLDRGGVL